MTTPADDSIALLVLLSAALSVALYVWTALALSAMFRKMGESPWKAWVPFVNVASVLTWGGFSPWLVLLALVPGGQVVVVVLLVVSAHRINPGFGYGGGMTVVAAFLFVVWASILGFGPARWLGARVGVRPAPPRVPPTGAPAGPMPQARPMSAPGALPTSVAETFAPESFAPQSFAPQSLAPAAPYSSAAPAPYAPAPPAPHGEAPYAPAPYAPAPTVSSPISSPPLHATSADAATVAPVTAASDSAAGGAAQERVPRPPVAPPSSAVATGAPVPSGAPGAQSVRAGFAPTPAPSAPEDGDAAWPSEIDDVSAIHPSLFPPSPAGERPFVAPPIGGTAAVDEQEAHGAAAPRGATFDSAERAPVESGPIAFVPGWRSETAPAVPSAPVTRVPAAPVTARHFAEAKPEGGADVQALRSAAAPVPPAQLPAPVTPTAQPTRARRTFTADDPDAFPELSGEVSAVIDAPRAGMPRSAEAAVSAQHRRAQSREPEFAAADDALEETIIARRALRATWELAPASGSPIPLTSSVVILGRRPAPDPAFPAAQLVSVAGDARTVSKTHARIEQRGDAWIVTDLGSTNGVLVRTLMGDEVEVEPGGQLDAGERFFLGDEEFHLRRVER